MNLYESKKLREERASVVKEMHELSAVIKNEDRNFTAEESEKFDRMDKAQEDLQERAEASSRIEKVEGLDCNIPQSQNKEYRSNPIITEDDKQNACKGWLLRAGGQDHLNKAQYTEAASKCGLNMNSNTMDVSLRAQSTTTTEGGHGINLSMFEGFDEVLLAHGGVRAAAKRINTSDGGAWHKWNADKSTHPIATTKPNSLGIYDMRGNVGEWVTTKDGPRVIGGSFRTPAEEIGPSSLLTPIKDWNITDPQLPRSPWWFADADFVGLRIVINEGDFNE